MCVHFRDINAQIEKESFPLPRIDEICPMWAGSRYYSSLYLLMRDHQVDVALEDRYKTAFVTHLGLFIYNVMPFGLCHAFATFQRLMQRKLGPLICNEVLVYLDDIFVYAREPNRLLDVLENVLRLLKRANLD